MKITISVEITESSQSKDYYSEKERITITNELRKTRNMKNLKHSMI